MTREEKIQWLLDQMFQNPVPKIKDWRSFLDSLTNDELATLMRVQKLDSDGVLAPGDILPMVEILEKYSGGKGVMGVLLPRGLKVNLREAGSGCNGRSSGVGKF